MEQYHCRCLLAVAFGEQIKVELLGLTLTYIYTCTQTHAQQVRYTPHLHTDTHTNPSY